MSVCSLCVGRMLVDDEPCPICGGRGDVCDADPTICETCDGIGVIYDATSDATIACPSCSAAGALACAQPVVVRESAERAWCAEHRPGAPPGEAWRGTLAPRSTNPTKGAR